MTAPAPDLPDGPARAAAYFDGVAADYDAMTAGRWSANERIGELLDLLAGAGPPARVLDLGAGTGQTVAAVRARFPAAAVVAVDVSAGMLARLRDRYAGVRTRCADAVDYLRRSTEVFDLVTSVGMLEVVPDLPLVVGLAARRLAAGGSVVATYEPVVSGLGEQTERRNLSRGRRPDGAEVAIDKHRWHVGEVAAALAGAGLAVREHRLSVAYVNAGTPVLYGAVWAATRRPAEPVAGSDVAGGQYG